ncbi:hypothetical protein DNTS_019027, partial [Danionella cerebrum]
CCFVCSNMAVVIRLQGLSVTAGSEDIRTFFTGLRIPDGGVHIIGGERDEAFIMFASDEDARRAMMRSGGCIKGTPVNLLLSSKSEMHSLLEESARKADSKTRGIYTEPGKRVSMEKGPMPFNKGLRSDVQRVDRHESRDYPSTSVDPEVPRQRGRGPSENKLYVIMRGMPYSASPEDVCQFFNGLRIDDILFLKNAEGMPSGDAIVRFATKEDAYNGLLRSRFYMGPRYVVVNRSSKENWVKGGGTLESECLEGSPPQRARSRSPISYRSRSRSPTHEEYCILFENLPPMVEKRDVRLFLKPVSLKDEQIIIFPPPKDTKSKSAFVIFKSLTDYCSGLAHNKEMLYNKIVYVSPISKEKMVSMLETSINPGNSRRSAEESLPQQTNLDSQMRCVYVRNLPFDIRKAEIINIFHGFGLIEDWVILVRNERVGLGEALVIFQSEDEAMAALHLNGKVFHGSELIMKLISMAQMEKFAVHEQPMDGQPDRNFQRPRVFRDGPQVYNQTPTEDFQKRPDFQQGYGGPGPNGYRRQSYESSDPQFYGPNCVKLVNLPSQIKIQEIYDFCYGYREIHNQSQECSFKVAKFPENFNRNRYRDVSPYDHSRVRLEGSENDYINASLITMEEAQRRYILTQGPLRNTCGHFWLMIWEQQSKAVIMLNRVIEKGSEKCAQYWPSEEDGEMDFDDTGFIVLLQSEDVEPNYTIRRLDLQNRKTGETRSVYHFHYTAWPDFGVPESPASFLSFLFKVRDSGSLGPENGPAVVHCSAGIGRSGTFALVDTCLVLMDKRKDPSSVDIQKVLLDMREYRMGLIQTPDQLRFSYMAVMEGAKTILGGTLQRPLFSPENVKTDCVEQTHLGREGNLSPNEEKLGEVKALNTRQRIRKERIDSTAQKVQKMKMKLSDSEKRKENWQFWKPVLLNVGVGAAVAMDIHGKIRDVLAETVKGERHHDLYPLTEEDFMHALQRRGIVDDVMKDLHFSNDASHTGAESVKKFGNQLVDQNFTQLKANISPQRRHLYLQVQGGKAFLEHLKEPEPLPGQVTSTFSLHLHFRNQRFQSKPVPCACEPDFQEGFLLEVHRDGPGDASKMLDATAMLSICDPVHMVLIKTDTSGETTLVSSYFLDWRTVLCAPSGKTSIAVELFGVGAESKIPAGVLNLKLELYPPLTVTLSPEVITTQKSLERQKTAEKERLFLVYAKQWWQEFLEIRSSNQSKLVKIFAQDENGVNRPVCSYVRVLRAGRLLESPRQAARFVSLLAQERTPMVGGGAKQEQWSSMMAFLCCNKARGYLNGDCEDHATLLCSLLLGFGMDAYVCVGTKAKNIPHTWVLTCGTDGSITFWESFTAHRYLHFPMDPYDPPAIPQTKPNHPYKTIGCVFNHKTFMANCQVSDAVETCVFDFTDGSRWKSMSEEALRSVCNPGSTSSLPLTPPLRSPSVAPHEASNQLELEMRYLIAEHRKDLGLVTVWDDHLSYLLSAALSAYELERCTGVTCGDEEFQDAVRRAVPDGHTFKGFPIHFLHQNARRVFATSLRSPFCEEIVCCRGDHVRLAVRVRVFAYPESTCAVWIMFACKYRSVL